MFVTRAGKTRASSAAKTRTRKRAVAGATRRECCMTRRFLNIAVPRLAVQQHARRARRRAARHGMVALLLSCRDWWCVVSFCLPFAALRAMTPRACYHLLLPLYTCRLYSPTHTLHMPPSTPYHHTFMCITYSSFLLGIVGHITHLPYHLIRYLPFHLPFIYHSYTNISLATTMSPYGLPLPHNYQNGCLHTFCATGVWKEHGVGHLSMWRKEA